MYEVKPEDVLKALETRGNEVFYGETKDGESNWVTYADVLALIRNLTEQNLALGEIILKKYAEIERLQNGLAISQKETKRYITSYKQTREEAITEFALRLKSCEFYEVADQYDGMQYIDFCAWVDQIAKEMKENTNEGN